PIVILVEDVQTGLTKTMTCTTATITDHFVLLQRLPGTRLEVGADASADGGQATLAPNTGTLQVFQPFDFRLSHDPARDGFIDVNGNPLQGIITGDARRLRAPAMASPGHYDFSALVYNSNEVSVRPIAETSVQFDRSLGVPITLSGQLTWNAGSP